MSRLSIRARLTAAFAAAMLLILMLAGLFVYLRVQSNLSETLDENLRSRADDVATLVASSGPGSLERDADRLVEGEDAFAQVVATGGPGEGDRLIASTLPGAAPAIGPAEARRASQGPVLLSARPVPGVDGQARILARPLVSGGPEIVVVGATTQDRRETLQGLRGAFLIGAPVAILLASALGYLLAGRALAPVEAMRRRAAGITLEQSGERLPLPAADDEIRHLGETLNAMLDRIEESLARERVFVADASHELRTPLAILRAELELAERPGRSPEDLRAAIASTAEEVDRLSRLAEDLLVIARSDQGRLPIKREPVELARLLGRVRDRFEGRAAQAGRAISVEAPDGGPAELDPMRIEQALENLVDNALRHGDGGIRLSAERRGGSVRLQVCDEGPGLPDGFEERAFERFTRADEGRSGGGAGLGLAIVRAIAQAHGGEAGPHDGGVELTLPSAPPS